MEELFYFVCRHDADTISPRLAALRPVDLGCVCDQVLARMATKGVAIATRLDLRAAQVVAEGQKNRSLGAEAPRDDRQKYT